MANIDVILNSIDDLLDAAANLPFTSKCMVDADSIRDLIDEIRLNLPTEIKQAKAVVSDRNEILSKAKNDAEELVRRAEERAKKLVESDSITMQANARASAIINDAQANANSIKTDAQNTAEQQLKDAAQRSEEMISNANAKSTETINAANAYAKEMKQAAYDFAEGVLRSTDETITNSLNNVRAVRKEFLDRAKNFDNKFKE